MGFIFMSNICPVCRLVSTKAKCEGCGFEMPVFAFLSEDDADKWHKDTVLPYRENWEKRKAKVDHCKNCGKELQEGWKVCPYCGSQIKVPETKPMPMPAVGAVPEDFKFEVIGYGKEIRITGYIGNAEAVKIPARIQDVPVTIVGERAFSGCGLTSVDIPSSVTTIGRGAFEGCNRLTSIIIPSSVRSFTGAFIGCKGLTSVTIPSSVTTIDSGAFYGCVGLTGINIPPSVTSIGPQAFSGCSSLTSVAIPSSVTSIGPKAFSGCKGLTSITIPSSVTTIGDGAFSGCSSLTNVDIPSSVKSIGSMAYSGCIGLTGIIIPSSVTSIGYDAFKGCNSLKIVTLSLRTKVVRSAFNEGVQIIFTEVIAGAVPEDFKFEVITYGERISITKYIGDAEAVKIPAQIQDVPVTTIGAGAFSDCSSLKSVDIPSSVTIIGNEAFSGRNRLTNVTIPSSVKTIGAGAFRGCKGLRSVEIRSSLTYIGNDMFDGCNSLKTVILSRHTKVERSAFSKEVKKIYRD